MTRPAHNLTNLLFFTLFLSTAVYGGQSTVPPIVDAVAEGKCAVVIDAGHGGGDWGVTARGVQEKNITLELAKKIKAKLDKTEKDVVAVLTRDGDDFMKIEDRAGLANKNKACVYISIHCDFAPSTGVEGYKVYYMEGKEAKPEDEKGLVKWNEAQMAHVKASKKLALYMVQYLRAALISEAGKSDENDVVPVPSRGEASIKSAATASVNAPAVVIEIGNLNNGNDFMNLKDSRILDRMAYHIKEGIVNFLKEADFNGGSK